MNRPGTPGPVGYFFPLFGFSPAPGVRTIQIPDAVVAAYLGDPVMPIVKTYVHATGTNPATALNRPYGGRKVGGAENAPAAGRGPA